MLALVVLFPFLLVNDKFFFVRGLLFIPAFFDHQINIKKVIALPKLTLFNLLCNNRRCKYDLSNQQLLNYLFGLLIYFAVEERNVEQLFLL